MGDIGKVYGILFHHPIIIVISIIFSRWRGVVCCAQNCMGDDAGLTIQQSVQFTFDQVGHDEPCCKTSSSRAVCLSLPLSLLPWAHARLSL